MAGKKVLTSENLKKLGAQRLADLLIEISTGNNAITRRLKLELTGEKNPEQMSKDLEKRLDTVSRTTKKVKKHEELAFSVELEAQLKSIVETLSKSNPSEAFRLLWKFVGISDAVINRCQGSGEHVRRVFKEAEGKLGALAAKSKLDTTKFAQKLINSYTKERNYNWPTNHIALAAPALDKKGMEFLHSKMVEMHEAVSENRLAVFLGNNNWLTSGDWQLSIWGKDQLLKNIEAVLCIIAQIRNDAVGYVKYYDREKRETPSGINEIAGVLLKSKKAKDVLKIIDSVDFEELNEDENLALELKDKQISALELSGKKEMAQEMRWKCFQESLSAKQLRDYISKLPDFDDIEAEEKAMNFAEKHHNKTAALYFFAEWPSLERVSKLVQKHSKVLETNDYEPLIPIAEALTTDYPVAAIHIYRSVINSMLNIYAPSATNKAARLYKQCEKLVTGNKNLGDHSVEDELTNWLKKKRSKHHDIWEKIYGYEYWSTLD